VNPSHYHAVPMRNPPPYSSKPSAAPGSLTPASYEASLPARRIHDSYSEITLPFGSNPELLEEYVNPTGGLRTGMLMEHLDSLAGSISYKHLLGNSSTSTDPARTGFYIVTAACDRLDMLAAPEAARDVRMSGHVIAVGRSSMEVAVKMEALGGAGVPDQTLLLGLFIPVPAWA
jgi:acyl-coenzyme A thioesterase 9